jgi:Flp pilus assembly protein TadG
MMRLRSESGQVLVIAALGLTVLLGLVAFATDIGVLFRAREVRQNAADSAAFAGAAEISYGDVTVAARADSAQNGVTHGVNGATVTVNNPPLSGPNAGNSGYVEVIVSQPQPTFFMTMFQSSSTMVSARAVAGAASTPSCIVTLQPTPQTPTGKKGALVSVPGMSLSGSANLTLSTCGILDGATGGDALDVSGGGSGGNPNVWISTPSLGVGGTITYGNGVPTNLPAVPITGVATPITDPLSSLVSAPPASDYSSGCISSNITSSTTIGPASANSYVCYNSLTATKGSPTITLKPGLYIFNGSTGAGSAALDIESGTVFNGTGVTFYFVNGAGFTFDRGATANISAPTAGTYSGILFYQDASDSAMDYFQGGSVGNVDGIFYLPNANFTLANGAAAKFTTDFVVGSFAMSGATSLTPYKPIANTSVLSSPRLAE